MAILARRWPRPEKAAVKISEFEIPEEDALNIDHPRQSPRLLACLLLGATLLIPARNAHATEQLEAFTVALLGGVGGTSDATPSSGYSNSSYQANFLLATEARTHLAVRVGQLDLKDFGGSGGFVDPSLQYVTIGGEYRLQQSFYESGIYISLGGYRLNGTLANGKSADESTFGVAVGATGEFKINRRLGVVLELSGHYADLDRLQFFAMAHAGLAVRF